jgi:hypothetical protein
MQDTHRRGRDQRRLLRRLGDDTVAGGQGGGNLSLGGESSVTLSPPRQFRLGVEVTF